VLAAAGEDLHAELVLEQADLLADARLRGEQALSGGRYVEVVVGDFPDVAELLELHDA
jgi:hypothetical protein